MPKVFGLGGQDAGDIDYSFAAMAVDVEDARASRPMAGSSDAARLAGVLPEDSRVNDLGHLEIGGCDVLDIVEEFGTPAYVFAEKDIRNRARDYVRAFERYAGSFEVLFASKALACTAAYRLLSEEGLSVDVASGGELFMALRAGIDPQQIYFHGNNKSESELRAAIGVGVGCIVVDSFDEIRLLDLLLDRPQDVLIRITPDVKPRTHAAAQTGQTDSKFGFGLTTGQASLAIDAVRHAENLRLVGLHAHIGSQILDLDVFLSEIDALASISDDSIRLINLGGGLGIPYLADERLPPSIDEYVKTIVERVGERFETMPQILIEPGRSLVGSAGITTYRVGTIKHIPDVRTYVAVDGGMSDNLRPMLYRSRYEALLANRANAIANTVVTIVGKHCETGDNLLEDAVLASPRVGDVLVMPATGAYGHSMANNYNGVPRPPVIFCKDGQADVVVRRETYEDLVARDC